MGDLSRPAALFRVSNRYVGDLPPTLRGMATPTQIDRPPLLA
jgi:hypothetical protein